MLKKLLKITHLRSSLSKKNFRKEERIQQILKTCGDHSGLVHIFSAMEPCPTYKSWHDKKSHRTVEKKDGTLRKKWATMKKGIYSLAALSQL
jgi:hypothetical protein